MKVLVISHLFPSIYDPASGVFVLEQAKAARKLGVELIVVAPTPWAPRLLRFLPRVGKYSGIPARAELNKIKVEYLRVLAFPRNWLFFLYGFFYYVQSRHI